MRTIQRIIVHHSAGSDTETVDQVRAFHVKTRGYSDIGYHWIIRRLFKGGPWVVAQGRPEEATGAHDQGQNADSLGICLLGDYTKNPVDPDAWLVLVALIANRCRAYNLGFVAVEGHRENEPANTPTACPGFDPHLLRVAVAEHMDNG